MLVDANLLLYAVDDASPFHDRAASWLTEQLNGNRRVGLPWPSLLAFVRIATNPRAADRPLTPDEAWDQVELWLSAGPSWIPEPTDGHAAILGDLVGKYQLRANLLADAHLAALAYEHGVTVCSADTDFARFSEVRWENPLAS
jgi:toxin-antitoxin system PIN domain toxin